MCHKRNPFSPSANFLSRESRILQAADDVALLVSQDTGENQYASGFQTPAPGRDCANQQLAEKIGGDDIEFFRRAMFGYVRDFEFDPSNSIQARITLCDRNRMRITIDRDYRRCAKRSRGQRQNATASSGIQHVPTIRPVARKTFKHSQAHRGCSVRASSECACRGNDDLRDTARFLAIARRPVSNFDAIADPKRSRLCPFEKLMSPIARQFFDCASKLFSERSRSSSRW
jgi:hypothetical protein